MKYSGHKNHFWRGVGSIVYDFTIRPIKEFFNFIAKIAKEAWEESRESSDLGMFCTTVPFLISLMGMLIGTIGALPFAIIIVGKQSKEFDAIMFTGMGIGIGVGLAFGLTLAGRALFFENIRNENGETWMDKIAKRGERKYLESISDEQKDFDKRYEESRKEIGDGNANV
jgi:hypothetical protein